MSDEIIRDVADVPEVTEETALMENAPEESAAAVNYSEKTLAELVALFEELGKNEDRMKLNKEAEAIKTAFYKRLTKEKAEAGDAVSEDAFTEIENGFKAYYNTYKKERAEYNARPVRKRKGKRTS